MKNIRNILFGLTMLLYLWFPINMITGARKILKEGVVHKFKPQPVDPYDAFRGRYITLGFDGTRINVPNAREQFDNDEKVYVILEKDEQGFARFSKVSKDLPKGEEYIKTSIRNRNENSVTIRLPENMQRFFLNEKLAPLAEKAYRELAQQNRQTTDSVAVYLEVRILNGTPVIEEMYMKDLPVSEYLQLKN